MDCTPDCGIACGIVAPKGPFESVTASESRRLVDFRRVKEQAAEICPVCKTGTLVVIGPARFSDGRQGVRLQCDACGNVALAEIGPLYQGSAG
jgi:hypothetical protein